MTSADWFSKSSESRRKAGSIGSSMSGSPDYSLHAVSGSAPKPVLALDKLRGRTAPIGRAVVAKSLKREFLSQYDRGMT